MKAHEERVLEAIRQLGPIVTRTPEPQCKLSELGLDSLAIIELTASLELSYGIMISDDDVQQFSLVSDIIRYVEQRARTEAVT